MRSVTSWVTRLHRCWTVQLPNSPFKLGASRRPDASATSFAESLAGQSAHTDRSRSRSRGRPQRVDSSADAGGNAASTAHVQWTLVALFPQQEATLSWSRRMSRTTSCVSLSPCVSHPDPECLVPPFRLDTELLSSQMGLDLMIVRPCPYCLEHTFDEQTHWKRCHVVTVRIQP